MGFFAGLSIYQFPLPIKFSSPCVLFGKKFVGKSGGKSTENMKFIAIPFTDWGKMERIEKHVKTDYHQQAVASAANFVSIFEGFLLFLSCFIFL